jgi:hypothetical protein
VGPLGLFVRRYLDAVVNQRDLAALDAMVSADYRGGGHGWPHDLPALRAFYRWQAAARPDWRVEVQETVEVGDCVVVRAFAGGAIAARERHRPEAAPSLDSVEWLAVYRISDELISDIDILAIRGRTTE